LEGKTKVLVFVNGKVRWWDSAQQPSPFSPIGSFLTGLWSPSDWKGQWVGGFNQLRNGNSYNPIYSNKSEFEISSFSRATVFISGLGYYELFINGQKVGPNKLDPGYTHYALRYRYHILFLNKKLLLRCF
jgi:alpha-L-rhamnosidase